jgi:hypothetical protein
VPLTKSRISAQSGGGRWLSFKDFGIAPPGREENLNEKDLAEHDVH